MPEVRRGITGSEARYRLTTPPDRLAGGGDPVPPVCKHDVVSAAAVDLVSPTIPRVDPIISPASVVTVGASAAHQAIRAGSPAQEVSTLSAEEHIGPGAPDEPVGSIRAHHRAADASGGCRDGFGATAGIGRGNHDPDRALERRSSQQEGSRIP